LLPNNVKIYKRDFSKLDGAALVNDIQTIDWDNAFSCCSDASSMFDSFYETISQKVDKYIPIKVMSKKELKIQSKPWITSAIRTSINTKNKFYKKFLKTRSVHYHSKFKYYRNKINHLIRLSKQQYYNKYFASNINNSKRVWKGIKKVIHSNPKSHQQPTKVLENNCEITDTNLIANAFNRYFTNIGNQLSNKIPEAQKSPLDYLTTPQCDSFCYNTVGDRKRNNVFKDK
jgi:hypothetical protein